MQHPRPGRSLDGMSGRRPSDHHASPTQHRPDNAGHDTLPGNGDQSRPESQQSQQQSGSPLRYSSEDVEQTDMRLDEGLSADRKPRRRKTRFLTWRKVVLTVTVVLLALFGGAAFVLWHVQNNLIADNPDGAAALLQENVDPDMLDGEGDGRINGLMIGIDDKSGLADTIILASFDPIAKDVVLLSIPRDLYVRIDGFGSAKINAAHAYGERYEYEGGGPALLKDTVSRITGVPIHYYGRVDFDGFEQAVDIVGGITVEVEEELHDPYYPDENRIGHDPLHIEAGQQHMDGGTALKYARSRKTTSDFDRNRRQQKILVALKKKVMSRNTLANPRKVTGLLNTLRGNARTNMSVDEIMRLVELGEGVTVEDVTTAQLDASSDGLLTFSNIHGQSALVPATGDFQEVRRYIRTLMVDSYIKDEAARISVLNGTAKAGLAAETADLLRSYGYDVANVNNAPNQDYVRTAIFDYTGDNPYTLRYLEKRFGVRAKLRQDAGERAPYDIEIVLGSDYEPGTE